MWPWRGCWRGRSRGNAKVGRSDFVPILVVSISFPMTETLLQALTDIRQRLNKKEYTNEEHIRFSLVGRVLLALGWNIWSPQEVCTEDLPQRGENTTKVDIRLHVGGDNPMTVYIECKRVGGLKSEANLDRVVRQVAGYNSWNGAGLIVLTDGHSWYLYSGTSQGKLPDRMFAEYNLLKDDLDHLVILFTALLGRSAAADGSARSLMEVQLKARLRYFEMGKLLEDAKTGSRRAPRRTLSQELVYLLHQQGFKAAKESEAERFLAGKKYDLAQQVLAARLPEIRQKLHEALEKRREEDAAAIKPKKQPHKEQQTKLAFRKTTKPSAARVKPSPEPFTITGRGAEAVGHLMPNGEMRVLAGSIAAGAVTKALAFSRKQLRSALLADKTLVRRNGTLRFTSDYIFDTPVMAAHVICGNPISAATAWKHKTTQKPLGDFLATKQSKS